MSKLSGSCLCGKIKLSIDQHDHLLSACHCNTCRKWSAGPLMTIAYEGEISFENKDSVKLYQSSEWAERGFCSECGTHLFYHLKNTDQYYIAAWVMDESIPYHFNTQVYIDKKPDCYDFANETIKLTEDDILKMISSHN